MGDSYDQENEFENDATVTIELDDGREIECVVLMIFDAGDEGREYIAVLPEDSDDESEVYLYRYEEDENGEPKITNIESDDEYDIVSEAFDEILDEQEYKEMLGSDDEDDYKN